MYFQITNYNFPRYTLDWIEMISFRRYDLNPWPSTKSHSIPTSSESSSPPQPNLSWYKQSTSLCGKSHSWTYLKISLIKMYKLADGTERYPETKRKKWHLQLITPDYSTMPVRCDDNSAGETKYVPDTRVNHVLSFKFLLYEQSWKC